MANLKNYFSNLITNRTVKDREIQIEIILVDEYIENIANPGMAEEELMEFVVNEPIEDLEIEHKASNIFNYNPLPKENANINKTLCGKSNCKLKTI
jgi:hypothetical protein